MQHIDAVLLLNTFNRYIFACDDYPAGIYLFKIKDENTRAMCEICSKSTMKTPERRHIHRSGVFIANLEQI